MKRIISTTIVLFALIGFWACGSGNSDEAETERIEQEANELDSIASDIDSTGIEIEQEVDSLEKNVDELLEKLK